jgi:hypothetical protein
MLLFGFAGFSQNLADSLSFGYLYAEQTPSQTTFYANANVLLAVLGEWQQQPSVYDFTGGGVETADLLNFVGGYASEAPEFNFVDWEVAQNYGEGNSELHYLGNDKTVLFGFLKRSPYDEVNEANYVGFTNLITWHIEVIKSTGVWTYFWMQ